MYSEDPEPSEEAIKFIKIKSIIGIVFITFILVALGFNVLSSWNGMPMNKWDSKSSVNKLTERFYLMKVSGWMWVEFLYKNIGGFDYYPF